MQLYEFPKEILPFEYDYSEELIEHKKSFATKDGKIITYKYGEDLSKIVIKFTLSQERFNTLNSFYELVKKDKPFIFYDKVMKFVSDLSYTRKNRYYTQVSGEMTLVEYIPQIFNVNLVNLLNYPNASNSGVYAGLLINNSNEENTNKYLYEKYLSGSNIVLIPLFYVFQIIIKINDNNYNYYPVYKLSDISKQDMGEVYIETKCISLEDFKQINSIKDLSSLIIGNKLLGFLNKYYSKDTLYQTLNEFDLIFRKKMQGNLIEVINSGQFYDLNKFNRIKSGSLLLSPTILNENKIYVEPYQKYVTSI